MSVRIKDLSVVLLQDGRKGTVVHVYSTEPKAVCVEIEDSHELVDVTTDQIAETIWPI